MTTERSPALSVIVPVRNEETYIASTLSQLLDQSLAGDEYEILVVDGESTDATRRIVSHMVEQSRNVRIRLLGNPRRLSSAARNYGVRMAQGEYCLVIDGHVHIPGRDLLKNSLELARRHEARCLGRPQPLNAPGISAFQRSVALARASRLAHSQESFVYTGEERWVSPISVGVMYRRDVFRDVGLFDENFDAAEDLEFNYRVERAGIQCLLSPRLTVFYFPRSSFSTLFRQMVRYGLGRALFVRKHPERFTGETVIPAAFVMGMTALILGALFSGSARLLLSVLVLVYGGILSGEAMRIYLRTGDRAAWRVPAIIAVVHTGLGFGFLTGLFRAGSGRRRNVSGEEGNNAD